MNTTAVATARTASLTGFASTLPGRLLIGLAATLVVAAAAHVALPLPFTPVPLTLQPLAVLGVGLALGPLAGFATMLAYLAEGAAGLPVFSPTGPGGVAQLLGPTGGFLLAYPLVAAVAGGLTRRIERSPASHIHRFLAAAAGGAAATLLLFVCGGTWLMRLAHLSLPATLAAAVFPFLPGEAVKVLIAAGVYKAFAPAKPETPTRPASGSPRDSQAG